MIKTHDAGTARTTASGLYVETWGDGAPVVLAHGSLCVGNDEWDAQRPLVDEGFSLRVFDRRGYGRSASAVGEDFLADADDIIELMADGAHLVGHSYGGLGVMLAAARRPDATLSLTVLEPAAATVALDDPDWSSLVAQVREMWTRETSDAEFVVDFLTAVGSNPDELPPELLAAAAELTPIFRRGRPFYEVDVPLAELAVARFPKLVVAGGHHAGFDAMCRSLAQSIGAQYAVVEGAGHEVQFTGQPVNDLLLGLWRHAG
jgi:pimeloyl-ACP methyl ester carboxylesterase